MRRLRRRRRRRRRRANDNARDECGVDVTLGARAVESALARTGTLAAVIVRDARRRREARVTATLEAVNTRHRANVLSPIPNAFLDLALSGIAQLDPARTTHWSRLRNTSGARLVSRFVSPCHATTTRQIEARGLRLGSVEKGRCGNKLAELRSASTRESPEVSLKPESSTVKRQAIVQNKVERVAGGARGGKARLEMGFGGRSTRRLETD